MTPHPKPQPRAKKPGAMKTKPKAASAPPPAQAQPTVPAKKSRQKAAISTRLRTTPKPAPKEGGTKSDLIIAMLKKPGGASSKEIEAATGWAPHSVRGFLGTQRKAGVKVVSKKFGKGEPTVYSIEAAAPAAEVGDVV